MAQKPQQKERDAWMKEMQQVKKDFISKNLELTAEQKAKFFPLYEKMENEVRQCTAQTSRMSRDVKGKGDKASDLEYEKAAEAMFELKSKEGAIEMKYYHEFKKVLTPRQLFKLKKAEKDFTKNLMKEYRKNQDDRHDKKKEHRKHK